MNLQRPELTAAYPRVAKLLTVINWPSDVTVSQAMHWYAMCLDFKPDLIIELGRGYGNSTVVLTDAANQIGAKVKSFCLTKWEKKRLVAETVTDEWFAPLELYTEDICSVDFERHTADFKRVVILWDAHGYNIADAVLGKLLPLIALRPHLVICHDISDNRFCGANPSYEDKPFWRGMDDFYAHLSTQPRNYVNLGWVIAVVDQVIPILDFCWRNKIELHSADLELSKLKDVPPFITLPVQWAYFTLNESPLDKFHFPTPAKSERQATKSFFFNVFISSLRKLAMSSRLSEAKEANCNMDVHLSRLQAVDTQF